MFFTFSKTVQPILWPFNIALLLLIAAFVLWRLKKEKAGRGCVVAAFCFLVIPAIPFFARRLLSNLESHYPMILSSDAPKADAIVILGGTAMERIAPRLEPEEIAGSRLVGGARLYRHKKAPFVIVSSGYLYQQSPGIERTESEDMRDFLIDQGVPAKAIVLESQARNTDENAKYVSALIKDRGWKKILLVTSARHVPRSVVLFKKYSDAEIVPFPTEKIITQAGFQFRDLIPDLASLYLTTNCIKEYVGRLVYQ